MAGLPTEAPLGPGRIGDTDPMSDEQLARYTRPGASSAINLRALTPFQRALLVTDGTVTKFIEAYTLEPVEVVRLDGERSPSTEDHRWLEIDEGTDVALRQVLIEGRYTRTLYVYAVSRVVLERLPERIRDRLEIQGEGLGRLLNEAQIETRREVLWYARERATDLPEAVSSRVDGEFVTRAYRIIAGRRPIALIIERFPCALGKLFSRE